FEPPTPASRTQYSTRLSYTPNYDWRTTEKDANSSKESLYFEAGRPASARRGIACVFERARDPDHLEHARKVAAPALDDRAAHGGSLHRRAACHGADQRQRRLALGQVVPQAFADRLCLARVIEHVVDQLERSAQAHAVLRKA